MAIAWFLTTISPAWGVGIERFSSWSCALDSGMTAAVLDILDTLAACLEIRRIGLSRESWLEDHRHDLKTVDC